MGKLMNQLRAGRSGKRYELDQAEKCGLEAMESLRRAVSRPVHPVWDHDGLHAVRMTRLAAHHAFKARPDLAPPDNYTIAKQELKEMRRKGDTRFPWL